MTIKPHISVIRIMTTRTLRLPEHVASMICMRNEHSVLVEKSSERPSRTWKDHIKVCLKEIMFEVLHWI